MNVRFREARGDDVPSVVDLLQDNFLDAGCEAENIELYLTAFDEMKLEGDNVLIVGEFNGRVVATYQITLIAGLSLKAKRRAQIESVRVASDLRGQGIGELLLADAESRAKAGNAEMIQLTANKKRTRARAFYARNGFEPSHEGFKKIL